MNNSNYTFFFKLENFLNYYKTSIAINLHSNMIFPSKYERKIVRFSRTYYATTSIILYLVKYSLAV